MNYFFYSLELLVSPTVFVGETWRVQKNKAIRHVVIRSHECKITTAAVTVLRGLLCCKWIYQSFLCIGA